MTEKRLPVPFDLYIFFSTLLGIGFIPFMPGTFGTLAAAGVYLAIPDQWLNQTPYILYLIGILAVFFFTGVFITQKAELKLGHDAGPIIWDEFACFFVATLFLPKSLLMAIYCFAIFRVFDIAKPWPIRRLQKLPHGWGIMTDDLVAAVFTNIFMQIMILFYPHFFQI